MDILEDAIAAILKARENEQKCPICGAPIIVAGGSGDSEIWYAHNCECLIEFEIAAYSYESNTIIVEDYPDYLSPQDESDSDLLQGDFELGFREYPEDPPVLYQNPYIKNNSAVPGNFNNISNLPLTIRKAYAKWCHNCKSRDGVNADLPECVEDPPYKYKCIYCGHSLRTHDEFGQGKIFDMAMHNISWRFDNEGKRVRI